MPGDAARRAGERTQLFARALDCIDPLWLTSAELSRTRRGDIDSMVSVC
jgi:hypothetical protein